MPEVLANLGSVHHHKHATEVFANTQTKSRTFNLLKLAQSNTPCNHFWTPGPTVQQAKLRSSWRGGRSKEKTSIQPCSTPVGVQEFLRSAGSLTPGLTTGLAVNSAVFLLGIKVLLQGLTPAGVAHSWLLGTSAYAAFGLGGYLLVCLYFVLGTAVTKLKLAQKQKEGIAEARSGRRGIWSVWGSGLAGAVCAIAALLTGEPYWRVGFVASFGSKLSDTVSSEVGKAYGKTTYLITSLERVPRGTEGAVSAEGTGAGVLAAAAYALMALLLNQVDVRGVLCVVVAATIANVVESYIGATLQGQVSWLTNDVVNIIQISIAAGLAVAGYLVTAPA